MTKTGNPAKDAGVMLKDACDAQHCVVDKLRFLSECLKCNPSFDEGIMFGLALILKDIHEQVFETVCEEEEALRLQKESLEVHHG